MKRRLSGVHLASGTPTGLVYHFALLTSIYCAFAQYTTMSEEPEEYLAVLKASYDYDPQSEEEIAIKEDQLLFLLQRVDEECAIRLFTPLSYFTNKL